MNRKVIFKVFTIKTAYSIENYIFKYYPQKKDMFYFPLSVNDQFELFMHKICFCDNYEISNVRNATNREIILLMSFLNQGLDFYTAGKKLLCDI